MFNEGNQIHNFVSSSNYLINYGSGSGSDFLKSYGSVSDSTRQKVTVPTVPVPVPQHCSDVSRFFLSHILFQCFGSAVSMGIQDADPDPDPSFYLNVDPNPIPDPGSQTNEDSFGSGSWSDVAVTKNLIFASLKGWKSGLFVNFGQFPCSWIRIRIPNSDQDLDPGDPNQCGFGFETLYIL